MPTSVLKPFLSLLRRQLSKPESPASIRHLALRGDANSRICETSISPSSSSEGTVSVPRSPRSGTRIRPSEEPHSTRKRRQTAQHYNPGSLAPPSRGVGRNGGGSATRSIERPPSPEQGLPSGNPTSSICPSSSLSNHLPLATGRSILALLGILHEHFLSLPLNPSNRAPLRNPRVPRSASQLLWPTVEGSTGG